MPITVYLSLRGDGASRVLENFRRALGEEAETLIVHPNRDDTGYYGSADVGDVAAAREAFATARKLYPAVKAFLGVAGREPDELPVRVATNGQVPPRSRPPEQKPRLPERDAEARPRAVNPPPAREPGKPREKAQEKPRGKDEAPAREGEPGRQRAPLRRRNRNQRRQPGEAGETP